MVFSSKTFFPTGRQKKRANKMVCLSHNIRIGVSYIGGNAEDAVPSTIYAYCTKCGKVFWWQGTSSIQKEVQERRRQRTYDGLSERWTHKRHFEPVDHFRHVKRVNEDMFGNLYVEEVEVE